MLIKLKNRSAELPQSESMLEKLKQMDKGEFLNHLKNTALVILGTVILAFGTGVFIIPFNLVVGGVSSIAIILRELIPIEALTVDIYVTVITWLFFFMGLALLGKSFALKTLISTIIYPIALSLFMHLVDPGVFGGFFNLLESEYSEIAILLAALFGGGFVGVGCAVTILGGGSTGGVDIITLVVTKYTKIKGSVVFFLVDATVILLGMFIIGNFVLTLLGIMSAFAAAVMLDRMFLGESKAFTANIVSDKHAEITEAVIKDMNRTATVFHATGGYSGAEKRVVMVSFTMRQYTELISIVSRIDKNAFITIHRAHEINGEGWTYEKTE